MNTPADIPTPETINALVGRQIKDMREKSGLSINAVEDATGIPVTELEHLEAGKDRIPADRLFRLAAFFNVTPDYFFEGLIKRSYSVSEEDIHQLVQNFLKVEGSGRGELFKDFVRAVTKK